MCFVHVEYKGLVASRSHPLPLRSRSSLSPSLPWKPEVERLAVESTRPTAERGRLKGQNNRDRSRQLVEHVFKFPRTEPKPPPSPANPKTLVAALLRQALSILWMKDSASGKRKGSRLGNCFSHLGRWAKHPLPHWDGDDTRVDQNVNGLR